MHGSGAAKAVKRGHQCGVNCKLDSSPQWQALGTTSIEAATWRSRKKISDLASAFGADNDVEVVQERGNELVNAQ